MTNYLIRLTPLSPFFFGGEKTFGDGTNTNYFAKSSPFPQQTSILGMLRKELLIQNNVYKENWGDYTEKDRTIHIPELIGHAFQINNNTNDFGKIHRLSPVFIAHPSGFFISEPKDHGFCFEKISGKCRLNHNKSFIPFLKNYDSKEGLSNGFVTSDSNKPIPFDQVFKAFDKVGNAKERAEDDSEKFFKQQFYTMINDYCFAFFAQLDVDLKNESIVFLGADNSTFIMQAEKTENSFEKLFILEKSHANKITLLSNALVDESIYDDCDFAITSLVDFRTIVMEEGRFKSKSGHKYTFLERGSVFFVENKASLEKKLKNNQLEKIGYNIFK